MAKKNKTYNINIARKYRRVFIEQTTQSKKAQSSTVDPIVLKTMTCYGVSMAHTITLSELDKGFNIALKEVQSNG